MRMQQGILNISQWIDKSTLSKTNIAPARRPSQKETHLQTPVFQVRF